MGCKIISATPALQKYIDALGQKEGLKSYLKGEDLDLLLAGAKEKFKPKEEEQIRREERKLYDLKQKIKQTQDSGLRKALNQKIEAQQNLIEDLKDKLARFLVTQSMDSIYEEAENNLAEIERILSGDNLAYEELSYAKDLIKFWTDAGDFTEAHPFLDEDEVNSPEIRDRFINYRNRAEYYWGKFLTIAKDKITEDVNRINNTELKTEELFQAQKDANGLSSLVLNLGRLANDLTNAIYKAVEKVNGLAQIEASERWKAIDDTYNQALPELKKIQQRLGNKTIFDIFRQKRDNGLETGNLVFRYTQDFFDRSKDISRKANRASADVRNNINPELANTLKNAAKSAWKELYKFQEENMLDFDPRMLFPDSKAEDSVISDEFIYSRHTYDDKAVEQHIEELKKHLGDKGYELYLKELEDKIEEFKIVRDITWETLQDDNSLTEGEKRDKFNDWLKSNSPYWALDLKANIAMRTKADGSYYNITNRYNISVPKKYRSDGNLTGWYDDQFEAIEAEDNVLEFYNLILDLLKENRAIVGDKANLQMNTIPFIKNTITDLFFNKGFTSTPYAIWNKFIEEIRTDDISVIDQSKRNPITGESEKELQLGVVLDKSKEIQNIVDLKIANYRLDNNSEPDYATKKIFYQEAIDQLAKEKSFDLVRIMKAYSMMALSYKHRTALEPFVVTANDMFKEIKRAAVNKAGIAYKDSKGEGKLATLQSALDFYLDKNFWKYSTKKVEGVTPKRALTTEESKKKKDLEDTKAELELSLESAEGDIKIKLEQSLDKINKQLSELGGNIVLSGIGDKLLQYVQLKGMGWNLFGALTNIGYGTISNWIEAADGRLFNQNELRRAYTMVSSSALKNASFDIATTPLANKIRALMDKFDVLSDSSQELYKRGIESSFTKNLKRFGSYNANQRAEYLNQAPVMIAMMLHEDIWDKFSEDGNTELTQDQLADFKLKLDRTIAKIHGDYKSPMKAKQYIIGRALLQFRTWMVEGFANRFESNRYDPILGLMTKGRYRTGVGVLSYAQGTGMNSLQQTLFNLKQLGKKLIFQKTQYDQAGFSEEDAANMRKNLNELLFYLSVIGLGLMLRAALPDDDEEDKISKIGLNLLINNTNRIQTDILFYSDPHQFEKLNKNILPVFQIVGDTYKLSNSISRQFSDEPNVQSGTFEGMNWALRSSLEALPYTNQFLRVYKSADYILGEK